MKFIIEAIYPNDVVSGVITEMECEQMPWLSDILKEVKETLDDMYHPDGEFDTRSWNHQSLSLVGEGAHQIGFITATRRSGLPIALVIRRSKGT